VRPLRPIAAAGAFGVASALVLGAAAAPAVAVWGGAERASMGPLDAAAPDVALNARGDAAAVWVRGSGRGRQIVASHRPLGGSWSRPEGISRRGRPAIDPRVAVGPDGRITVVWRQVVRSRVVTTGGRRRSQAVYVARARVRPLVADRWEPVATLSDPRQKVGRVFLAVDGRGLAVAAWHWGTGTRATDPGYVGEVQLAEQPLGGACVQVRRPRVAAGSSGHAAVWWQCDLGGRRSVGAAVGRGPDEAFGPEARLAITGGRDIAADLAIGPDGRAVAVEGSDGTLRWWRGPVSAAGVALEQLPALVTAERLARGVGSPRIAVGPSGDALSAWIAPGGITRLAAIGAGLGVAAPLTLGSDPRASRVRVAAGGARLGAVAWLASGRVLAVGRGADGNSTSRATLSGRGVRASEGPALAMDTAGTAVALWSRVRGGRSVVERAQYVSP
jgi:hypothetical protein